ncbi:zinc transporter 1 [Trichonephila clavipes]|nr:zinc transporter 1 [Trichonephila clavipes]
MGCYENLNPCDVPYVSLKFAPMILEHHVEEHYRGNTVPHYSTAVGRERTSSASPNLAASDFHLFLALKRISPEDALETMLKSKKPLSASFVDKALDFFWRGFETHQAVPPRIKMQSSVLYLLISLSGMVFGAEIVASHITQSIVLLISAYHMLYNILSLLLLVISHRVSMDGGQFSLQTES